MSWQQLISIIVAGLGSFWARYLADTEAAIQVEQLGPPLPEWDPDVSCGGSRSRCLSAVS